MSQSRQASDASTLTFPGSAVLAPMAGVTDRAFRRQCRRFGAAATTSEMLISDERFWHTRKSSLRLLSDGPGQLRIVQIAGSEPGQLAQAAQRLETAGVDIIDINMGCPAKKVCKRAAGSALLKDEALVADILQAVCGAVSIPVTLKIRTGWSPEQRNGVAIARIAEDAGIRSLAVHGRTRACRFNGHAEYDSIAKIVDAVAIPVWANGDITTAKAAAEVLQYTKARGVMIGRGALGQPWLFAHCNALINGQNWTPPAMSERLATLSCQLTDMCADYGETQGCRIGRKHAAWYFEKAGFSTETRRQFNQLETLSAQLDFVQQLGEGHTARGSLANAA